MNFDNLPEGWELVEISKLCELNPKHSKNISNDTDVSFIPMSIVDEKIGKIPAKTDIRKLGEVRKGYTHFGNGDVIFAKITPCMENGKSAVAENLCNGLACGSTEFYVLRTYGAVLPQYLLYFLRQKSYLNKAAIKMTSTVGHARLPKNYLLNTQIPIPPLNEQIRIVAKIEALQEKINQAKAQLERVQILLKKLRRLILRKAFKGQLTEKWRAENPNIESAELLLERIKFERRKKWEDSELEKMKFKGITPKDDKWKDKYKESEIGKNTAWFKQDLYDLPDGWFMVKLGYITELSKAKIEPKDIELIPYIGLEHIEQNTGKLLNYGSSDDIKSTKSKFKAGDVLYGRLRPYLNKVCLVNFEGICSTDILVFSQNLYISNKFLAFRFLSNDFVKYAHYNSHGTQLPRVNFDVLAQFYIGLPPLAEQEEIVKKVAQIFQFADIVEQKVTESLKNLERLNRKILGKAFRGELVPQDTNDEPASILLERIKAQKVEKPPKKRRKS